MGLAGHPGVVPTRRDPLLITVGVAAALVISWYALDLGSVTVQTRLFWVLQPPLDLLLGYCAWRTSRLRRLSRPARRFFATLAFAGAAFAVGDSGQAVSVLRDQTPQAAPGAFQSTLFAVGAGALLLTMLTYPSAVRTRRERVRFWIDAGTVLVGAAVVVWASLASSSHLITSLVTGALVMGTVFAASKLLLAGNAPMTRRAALPTVAAALLQGAALLLMGTLGRHHPNLQFILQVLPSFLIVTGPRIQELELRSDVARAARPRRPYSLLPYGMIITADVTLLTVLPKEMDARAWGAMIGVILITGLVVWRQLHGFTDNRQLIAALDQKVEEIGRQERRFRSLVQYSSDITVLLTGDLVVSYASPATERVLGLRPEELVGRDVIDLIHPEDRVMLASGPGLRLLPPGAVLSYQVRISHADGDWRWLEIVGTNLLDDPSVAGIVCNCRDVTDARRFSDQLRHEASHDGLTQLANRRLFTERLAAAVDAPVAVLMIDLDDFKGLNDRYGHHLGDAVLAAVADRLNQAVRAGDTPARLGGDEFAVLLPGATDDEANAVADRILALLTPPVFADGRSLTVRASVGVTTGSAADPDLILRQADAAMYAAKNNGKGRRAGYSLAAHGGPAGRSAGP